MKDAVLSALFKIPDPITADEFFSSNWQNGVSRSSRWIAAFYRWSLEREVPALMARYSPPPIRWNEWLRWFMKLRRNYPERQDWRAGWIRKPISWRMMGMRRKHVWWRGGGMNRYLKEKE